MSSTLNSTDSGNEKDGQPQPVPEDLAQQTGTVPPGPKTTKRKIWLIFITTFLALQVLFMGMISHLFGSVYNDDQRVNNLNVLFVDYDSGVFGESFCFELLVNYIGACS
jgi:hypothetical protein